jgi:hypothetical protein
MALTLSDEAAAALADMAAALGQPASTLAAEFLHELAPQFHGIAKMARAAKTGNKAAARRVVAHMLGDQYAQLMAMQQPELFGKPKSSK